MSPVDIVMCAGLSPSARVVRQALARVAEIEDIVVHSTCGASAGVERHRQEIVSLNPRRTLVVDGCDGFCGLLALRGFGVEPIRSVYIDNVPVVTEKAVADTAEKVLKALKEMNG